jgi:DNA-binding NtrC family response regulator
MLRYSDDGRDRRQGVAGAKRPPQEIGMTRVLVVHHDIDLADQEADALRRAGYQVTECMGPIGAACPILAGIPCGYAEDADVLLYDAFVTGEPDGAKALIERIREIHPDVPVVLTATGMEPDWAELAGEHKVTPFVGQPTAANLSAAIERALADEDEAPGASGSAAAG